MVDGGEIGMNILTGKNEMLKQVRNDYFLKSFYSFKIK